MKQRITTVGKLRKVLRDISDETQICISDDSLDPCKPHTFDIYTSAIGFIDKNINEDCIEYTLEDMRRSGIKSNAVVIYVVGL